jgi:ribonuclease HII
MGGLGAPDRAALGRGFQRVCGLDEAGRGPLAGPVVAAAVVFSGDVCIPGLADSKVLRPAARARLVPIIREAALGVGLGVAAPEEIDRLNILRASLFAMVRAIEDLSFQPDFLLVDGVHPVPLPIPQRTLIRGDAISTAVSAASVLAKEHRDSLMRELAQVYPGYGFDEHKGYATLTHIDALRRLGPTPAHRASFRGVRELLGTPVQLGLFSRERQ